MEGNNRNGLLVKSDKEKREYGPGDMDRTVGINSGLSRKMHQPVIVQHSHKPLGDILNHFGNTVRTCLKTYSCFKSCGTETERCFFIENEEYERNDTPDCLSGKGSYRSSSYAHIKYDYQQSIQYNVGNSGRQGNDKRQCLFLRSDKEELKNIHERYHCHAHQHDPSVHGRTLKKSAIRLHKPQERLEQYLSQNSHCNTRQKA